MYRLVAHELLRKDTQQQQQIKDTTHKLKTSKTVTKCLTDLKQFSTEQKHYFLTQHGPDICTRLQTEIKDSPSEVISVEKILMILKESKSSDWELLEAHHNSGAYKTRLSPRSDHEAGFHTVISGIIAEFKQYYVGRTLTSEYNTFIALERSRKALYMFQAQLAQLITPDLPARELLSSRNILKCLSYEIEGLIRQLVDNHSFQGILQHIHSSLSQDLVLVDQFIKLNHSKLSADLLKDYNQLDVNNHETLLKPFASISGIPTDSEHLLWTLVRPVAGSKFPTDHMQKLSQNSYPRAKFLAYLGFKQQSASARSVSVPSTPTKATPLDVSRLTQSATF